MWTKDFWKALVERAVKSLAQGFLVSGIGVVGVLDLDWKTAAALAASYALASVLTSLVSGAVQGGNISVGGAETVKDVEIAQDHDNSLNFDPAPGEFGTTHIERERAENAAQDRLV